MLVQTFFLSLFYFRSILKCLLIHKKFSFDEAVKCCAKNFKSESQKKRTREKNTSKFLCEAEADKGLTECFLVLRFGFLVCMRIKFIELFIIFSYEKHQRKSENTVVRPGLEFYCDRFLITIKDD